jgi:hypothetical protein
VAGIAEPGESVTAARCEVSLVQAYLHAKRAVLSSPYSLELLAVSRGPQTLSESQFLRELAWVILSGGMAEAVIRRKFPDISSSFYDWQSARRIADCPAECVTSALRHFRHEGKIWAIATAASMVAAADSFQSLKERMLADPIRELQSFPYIGPITAFHIAKNIGVKVAKPDRHMTRLARSNGFQSAQEFCQTIARFLGEDIRVVDSVLWRFATMHNDYARRFSQFMVA